MWTSYTIKDQLLKEKDLEIDFHMLTIKFKLFGWSFHAWTQICKRKEMIHKGWGQTRLLQNFIPDFQMEALRINVTKSLFSSHHNATMFVATSNSFST
jgi:hypothetical protein